MKRYFFITLFLFIPAALFAQDRVKEKPFQFFIDGEVMQKTVFKLSDSAKYTSIKMDSLVVYNHLMEKRKTIQAISGVLLTDIINEAKIKIEKPKLLSEFYITCISHDGYKVVFSWNELFNTPVGKLVMIVKSMNRKNAEETNDGITLLSGADAATGRRLVYDLEKVIVSRTQ